jgi:hypothetical protein
MIIRQIYSLAAIREHAAFTIHPSQRFVLLMHSASYSVELEDRARNGCRDLRVSSMTNLSEGDASDDRLVISQNSREPARGRRTWLDSIYLIPFLYLVVF